MLFEMAKEAGVEARTPEELIAFDRTRKGKRLSNKEWVSTTGADARIAKLKDGRSHISPEKNPFWAQNSQHNLLMLLDSILAELNFSPD